MARVTGIGGVFFKVEDPERTRAWYKQHLGIDAGPYGHTFAWRDPSNPEAEGRTVWNPFPADSTYFDPTKSRYMINYIVDDLHGLLAQLRAAGVQVDDKVEEHEYGKFGWAVDVDGNRMELWEPPAKLPEGVD
ncbi:Glyoxalase/Bleomycin resistance protein/Dioxygenase family protein [Enhygromyxa salina]|uniref:Glyoxalase/Bleomycin resistance protein/Dioxygenase family protein n=1 Tax=Enhygromyxa salina TaxID=215803 RepID=A0A0C2D2G1_9BACT|nr:VOC family protein [Enhygromyxa salina]KIG17466.1 Glyoxalase/Bleomycin resistance protein/Dioxygenase family protein [Enhygromyxa salina]